MATIEPGAIAASRRSVAAVAALVMYIETPLDDTSALAVVSKPASSSACHQSSSASKSTGIRRSVLRHAVAELLQPLPLPCLGAGLVDLEHPHAVGELGVSLGERVEPGAEEDVLADALLDEQVLDEPGAGDDRGAIAAGADRVHVRPVAPAQPRATARARPISSSIRCGGASSCTCRARHSAVRTALLSGATFTRSHRHPVLHRPVADRRHTDATRHRRPTSTVTTAQMIQANGVHAPPTELLLPLTKV